jgi:hypothetical protein
MLQCLEGGHSIGYGGPAPMQLRCYAPGHIALCRDAARWSDPEADLSARTAAHDLLSVLSVEGVCWLA